MEVAEAALAVLKASRGNTGWNPSVRSTDFTPTILNPNAEAVILAFPLALVIASLIRPFFIFSSFLSDRVKSILLMLFAPAAVAVSTHFDILAALKLSVWIELVVVNPVILPWVSRIIVCVWTVIVWRNIKWWVTYFIFFNAFRF